MANKGMLILIYLPQMPHLLMSKIIFLMIVRSICIIVVVLLLDNNTKRHSDLSNLDNKGMLLYTSIDNMALYEYILLMFSNTFL